VIGRMLLAGALAMKGPLRKHRPGHRGPRRQRIVGAAQQHHRVVQQML
jgi:hypothetical protein